MSTNLLITRNCTQDVEKGVIPGILKIDEVTTQIVGQWFCPSRDAAGVIRLFTSFSFSLSHNKFPSLVSLNKIPNLWISLLQYLYLQFRLDSELTEIHSGTKPLSLADPPDRIRSHPKKVPATEMATSS